MYGTENIETWYYFYTGPIKAGENENWAREMHEYSESTLDNLFHFYKKDMNNNKTKIKEHIN